MIDRSIWIRRSWWEAATLLGAAALVAACGGDESLGPSGGLRSGVVFDLDAPLLSQGRSATDVCSEADLVTLAVLPGTPASSSDSLQSCAVTFPVEVPEGRVDFTAVVWGNDRALLSGEKDTVINTEPWSVDLSLDPIPALEVLVNADSTAPPNLAVTVSGRGGSADTVRSITPGVPDTLSSLAAGPRPVALLGAASCVVMPGSVDTVDIPTDSTEVGHAMFAVTNCSGTVADSGAIEVVTTTTGSGGPPNYLYSVDSATPQPIGPNDMIVIPDTVGPHTVELSGLGMCTVPDTTLGVTVIANSTVQASFPVMCPVAPDSGWIKVVTTTADTAGPPDAPPNYFYSVDSGTPLPIGPNDMIVIPDTVGMHTVELSGLGSCTVPDTILDVTVTKNDTVPASFQVNCTGMPVGLIELVTRTVGSGGPPSYMYSVDSGPPQMIGTNTFAVILVTAGDHTVELLGFAPCELAPPTMNPRNVTVPADSVEPVLFRVDCSIAEPPPELSSLMDVRFWSRSPLLDPRRRRWYAARAPDGVPEWIM